MSTKWAWHKCPTVWQNLHEEMIVSFKDETRNWWMYRYYRKTGWSKIANFDIEKLSSIGFVKHLWRKNEEMHPKNGALVPIIAHFLCESFQYWLHRHKGMQTARRVETVVSKLLDCYIFCSWYVKNHGIYGCHDSINQYLLCLPNPTTVHV